MCSLACRDITASMRSLYLPLTPTPKKFHDVGSHTLSAPAHPKTVAYLGKPSSLTLKRLRRAEEAERRPGNGLAVGLVLKELGDEIFTCNNVNQT